MAHKRGGASAIDPNVNLLYRIEEQFFGPDSWLGGNQPPAQKYTGPNIVDSANRPFFLGNNALGGGGVGVAIDGRRFCQRPSAAGFQIRRGGSPCMPFDAQFQTAGAFIPTPFKSYFWELSGLRFTVQGGAAIYNMALTDTDSGFLNLNRPGAGWICNPAVNGGRLTPAHRRTNGGALVLGPDSGVTLLGAWHRLGLRFVEGIPQRFEWLIDGVIRHSISGDANLAFTNPGGGQNSPHYAPELGWATAGAGSTAQESQSTFEVRFLS